MPEAQANRRTSAARRRQQREDASRNTTENPTSFVDSSVIQDRIRKWQNQHVAEAVDPDILSVRSLPRSERSRTPMRTHSPAQLTDNPQSTPRRRSTKWVQQESTWVKQRRSVREQKRSPGSVRASKERVVEPPVKEETPPVEYSRNDSLRTRNVNSSRAERDLRRKRRREARAKADNGHALVEDGIRVYARSESHPASERFERDTAPARSEILDDQGSVQEVVHEPETQHARSTDQGSPRNIINEHPYRGDEDESPERDLRQPSRYAQTLGRAPEPVETLEQPKTRKRIIFNKTREILIGRNDAQPPVSNRIPSIEAWLEEQPDMPDPFVDRKEDSVLPPLSVPKAPKHRSHRKKVPSEPTIVETEDPNKIWDFVAPVQQHEPRKPSKREPKNVSQQSGEASTPKRRLFSFEVCDEPSKGEEHIPQPPIQEDVESQSPVTLKRRGAKTIKHARQPQPERSPPTQKPDERSSSQSRYQSGSQTVNQSLPVKRPLPQIPTEPVAEFVEPTEEDAIHLDRAPSRGLKRKLTTHEDLLSVLSLPRARRSTRSNLSVRHAEAPSTENIIREAIRAMQQEEPQYVRELRTLVDGVTPVLLQSLLSKSDAAVTGGLFSDNKNNDADYTRPIIQMGGALERLKNLHGRIPLQEPNIESLLSWAVTAHKYYSDYVKSWRLGFQGIIVNLAPLDGTQTKEEDMLSRDVDGDVTDEQGQKVDVAYLQKRPLIRIKKLSKLFNTIRDALPGNKKASTVADTYTDLTEFAKQRHGEEQGRLEDEAATNTDTTRARDIKTMGVTEYARIDPRRKVRARDYFDLTLQHSNGQRIDCKVEIILRDDPHPSGAGGDILICQVEEASKWLLFAPVNLYNVSVRRDKSPCDLVLMVKGVAGIGQTWYELLALRAEEQEAVTEWLHMLSSNPLPPKLNCVPSWQQVPEQRDLPPEPLIPPTPAAPPIPLSRNALASIQSDVDIPIGEPSVILTRRKKKNNSPIAKPEEPVVERATPKLSLGGGLQRRDVSDRYQHLTPTNKNQNPVSLRAPERSSPLKITSKVDIKPEVSSHGSRQLPDVPPRDTNVPQEPLVPKQRYSPQKIVHNFSDLSGATSTSRNSYFTEPEVRPYADVQTPDETRRLLQEITNAEKSWTNEPLMSGGLGPTSPYEIPEEKPPVQDQAPFDSEIQQPKVLPQRLRRHSRSKSSTTTPLSESIREQWSAMSGFKKKHQSTPNTPEKESMVHDMVTEREVISQPRPQFKQESPSTSRPQSRHEPSPISSLAPQARPLPPPPQKSYTISSSPQNSMVSLQASLVPQNSHCVEPTSPLKNQYQPSSSASGTESDDDETDATSDISDDIGSEVKDQATPLVAVSYGNRRASNTISKAGTNVPSTGTRTLNPSDSASNGPYRQAPPPSAYPAEKKKRTIAMVCSWSDRGIWEPIRDEECSIVISPGLVQAFPMSAAHSQPMSGAEWEEGGDSSPPAQLPLVEFELTPVVPLRKGTALDITIRSPPTKNSTVTTTNNVMFRSRTVQECERLYQYINWARCHNPVFAQLARDRPQEPVTFASNVQQNKSRSWFSFGSREKTSYRAPSRPPASMADTAASSSSATSAFSALRRFGKNSPFSIKRSSVIHQPGMDTSGGSLYSSSNGTGPSSGSSTPAPSQAGYVPGPDGPNVPQTSAEAANGGGMVNNMKVRFFVRVGQNWKALGPSLLTVLPATVHQQVTQSNSPGASTPGNDALPPQRISRAPTSMPQPRTSQFRLPSSGTTPHRIHGDGREKRVLITNSKRKEIVLLDEILGESCFEKVMQTGIAVKVWKEDEEVPNWGGVMTGKQTMYMIQFRTATEASWVFNMCGTYRYGNGPVA